MDVSGEEERKEVAKRQKTARARRRGQRRFTRAGRERGRVRLDAEGRGSAAFSFQLALRPRRGDIEPELLSMVWGWWKRVEE
jgi:hypothetical protein